MMSIYKIYTIFQYMLRRCANSVHTQYRRLVNDWISLSLDSVGLAQPINTSAVWILSEYKTYAYNWLQYQLKQPARKRKCAPEE